jgi:hypothetical protein
MILRRAISSGRVFRCLAAAGLVVGAASAGAVALPGAAHADSEDFAPAATATIHPGVMVESPAGQCTSNFVFGDRDGGDLYLGQAAHCTGTGTASDTDGCKSGSLPIGTPIKIEGASKPGELVYNSWLAMADDKDDKPDANTCGYNDFALVKIDPADRDKVSPTVPVFGGPTGLRTEGVPAGSTVYSYQNSSLRQGIGLLSPKQGLNLGDSAGGWTHEVATITPGVPGDSGSGFMDAAGYAFGVLSTLNLEPAPGTNGVGDLNRELAYANAHGMDRVVLQIGGPFHPPLPLPSLAGTPRADAASSDSDGETAAAEEPEQSVSDGGPSANTPDRGLSITPKRSEPELSSQPGQQAPEKQPGLVGGL